MSCMFFWPNKYFFYPIGNTSAVSLTRDLSPEQSADLLLLGCGDPRHILYSLFCEPDSPTRKLDFTCVDSEPAVLARNVLLFTLIADHVPVDTIWNIFYHLFLDIDSHSALLQQCQKLVDAAENMATWRSSPYSVYIRASTEHSLSEIRRHWSLYLAFPDLPSLRQQSIREAYSRVFTHTSNNPMTSVRSAGPLIQKAATTDTNRVKKYWKTGTTFLRPGDIASADLINPTFAYSLAGEGCAVHYATDPVTAFHSAALYGNANAAPTVADIYRTVKEQFSSWCTAFLRLISHVSRAPRIRVFLAEATAACRALHSCLVSGTLELGIPVAQFTTKTIHLEHQEYVSDGGPVSFDVVETSNLIDHIGLLNVLVAAVPLMRLPPRPSGSVLYTESLRLRGEDATKEFGKLLFADMGTMGILLDLCPIDYISGFTTRSNTHELVMHQYTRMSSPTTTHTQFQQVTTWKSPASCDSAVALRDGVALRPPLMDSRQLGTLLFDIYQAVFEQEDATTFVRLNHDNMGEAAFYYNNGPYMRESFVLFLRLVRGRLQIPRLEWMDVMDRFLDLETSSDTTMPMNTVNRNDLYAHLHRHGVYTVEIYRYERIRKIGRFSGWDVVPPVVRVVLSIPRETVHIFEDIIAAAPVGMLPMHCDILGAWSHNVFSGIHVAYGRAILAGTSRSPRAIFEEDAEGKKGSLPLVASFVLPARLLTEIEPPQDLKVRLCVRVTPGTLLLEAKLGASLEVFSASLMDRERIHILPEPQLPSVDSAAAPSAPSVVSPHAALRRQLGTQGVVSVELDQECELVKSLTTRIDLEDQAAVRDIVSGTMPKTTQGSPCVMRLSVASHIQDVVFPFPVVGSQSKLRLARQSRYIEVVVPIAGPFLKPDGMKLNPFPIVGSGKVMLPWNVHRLSLLRSPTLNLNGSQSVQWLKNHVGSMLSTRERKMRKKRRADGLLFVKTTLQTIFARSTGALGGSPVRIFALRDEATNNCDTIFFISDLRYDLHSHTIVCDGYVLPLTDEVMPRIESFFGRIVNDQVMESVRVFEGEMEAWKQLIPAFVERCRTWEHTDNCEYLASKEVPLTLKMESDPLCSCGRGKDVDSLLKVPEWRRYAPYVTRLALSPLFAVSYLETVGRDPAAYRCVTCRGKGKPNIMACKACGKARYCSVACQRQDWPRHRLKCKA